MERKAQGVSAIVALLAVSMSISARAQPSAEPEPEPEPGAAPAIASQPVATDFALAPNNHQDEEQQSFDRNQCDSQARRQSGYDPANKQEAASLRAASEEYVRAMTACLARQGYEVRYAPAEVPPPPPLVPYQLPGSKQLTRELRYRAFSLEAGGGYSFAAGSTADYVRSGANAGVALNWFPTAALPVGVRIEGGYMWFKPGGQLLALNGVGYNRGQQDLYGGDVDLRLNLSRLPARQQLYLAAGIGWYRIDTLLQEFSVQGLCGVRFCGVDQTLLAEEHNISHWKPSWNAGLGWEIALDSHTAFFLEARYRLIHRDGGVLQLIPISLGLRF